MELRKLNLENKRGDFTGLLYLIVSIVAMAFFLLIVGFITNEMGGEIKDQLDSNTPEVNESIEASINTANRTLSSVWYVMFGGLVLGLFITAWHMRTEPIYVPVFIILLIVTIIIGIIMSNAYESLRDVTEFSDVAATQTSISFMMDKLPYIALIIGLLALIITFAKPRGGESPIM